MTLFTTVTCFLIVVIIAVIGFCVKSAASVIDEELNRDYREDENDGL